MPMRCGIAVEPGVAPMGKQRARQTRFFLGGTCGPNTRNRLSYSYGILTRPKALVSWALGLRLVATKLRSRQTATINFIMAKEVNGCCFGSSWRSLYFCELIFVWFFIVIWFLLNIYSPHLARTPDLRKKVKVSAIIVMIECERRQTSFLLYVPLYAILKQQQLYVQLIWVMRERAEWIIL